MLAKALPSSPSLKSLSKGKQRVGPSREYSRSPISLPFLGHPHLLFPFLPVSALLLLFLAQLFFFLKLSLLSQVLNHTRPSIFLCAPVKARGCVFFLRACTDALGAYGVCQGMPTLCMYLCVCVVSRKRKSIEEHPHREKIEGKTMAEREKIQRIG